MFTSEDYAALVGETAGQFIEENTFTGMDKPSIRPETALHEMLEGVTQQWSDDDAISCLQHSKHPRACEFSLGGADRPASDTEPFPFLTFAAAAFDADVRGEVSAREFDWEAWGRLKTETNTPEMGACVLAAFREWWGTSPEPIEPTADFEHGQWFITDKISGAQWSAVDAIGGDAVDGFSFEQLTEGDR